MQLANFNNETFYVITAQPNWEKPVKMTLSLPSKTSVGKSDRMATRATAEALRVAQYSYSLWMEGDELSDFLAGLKQRTTERLLVPVWTEVYESKFEAGLYLHYTETDEHEVDTWEISESAVATGDEVVVPLLIMDFKDDPKGALADDECVDYALKFEEDAESEYALKVVAGDAEVLTYEAGGVAYPYFDQTPNYELSQSGGQVSVLMSKARQLGAGRRIRKAHYGAMPARELALKYETMSLEESLEFLQFWEARKGSVERFWVSGQLGVARVAEDGTQATDTVLVEDASGLSVGQFLCFEDHVNEASYVTKVVAIEGYEVTLSDAIGNENGWLMQHMAIRELLLVRCEHTFLKLTWDTDESFFADLKLREVPAELLALETPGQTIGALPIRKTLYTVYDADGNEWLYTSHESDLQWDGKSFARYPITHGAITSTINLSDNTKLSVEAIAGSPFMRFANVQTYDLRRLWCKIERVEIVAGAVTQVVKTFIGEFLKPELDLEKGRLKISCAAISRDLERKCPTFKFQRQCNWKLYSEGCGLSKDAWAFTETVLSVNESFNFFTIRAVATGSSWGRTTYPNRYYTYDKGYVTISGQRVSIRSVRLSGDTALIYLNGSTFPTVGSEVQIQSGCDGSQSICQKFGNYANWGGAITAPANLALVKVSSNLSGGGKKG